MKTNRTTYYIFLFALLFLNFTYCKNPKNALFTEGYLIDAIHKEGVNDIFRTADGFKYTQDYVKAAQAFEQCLQQNLNIGDKQYAINQLAFVNLSMNEDSTAKMWLDKLTYPLSKTALADYDYNVGVWAYHTFKPKMAEVYLRKAMVAYDSIYGSKHLKMGLCLTQLGMLYYEFAQVPDSAYYYMPLANVVFQSQPNLRKYSGECELGMSWVSYSRFDNEGSLAHCENLLQIINKSKTWEIPLYARGMSQKGRTMKKKGELESDEILKKHFFNDAKDLLEEAIKIGHQTIHIRQQEIFRNAIMYYAQINDSMKFELKIKELEQLLTKQPNRFGQIDWFRGMWFDFRQNERKTTYPETIYWYRKFWSIYKQDTIRERRPMADATYILYANYKKINQFDSALYFIKHSITLGTTLNGKDLVWADILVPEVINSKKLIYNSCIEAADCLLKQYYKEKDKKILNDVFIILKKTDELMFSKPLITDEDAILSFQKEYGDKIDVMALETLFNLYKNSNDILYCDYAFKFIERMKSLILFRNIVSEKNINIKHPSVQLIDSIRFINTDINKLKSIGEYRNNSSFSLSSLQTQLDDIYATIKKDYPDYHKAHVVQPIPNLQSVQKKLNKDDVLLFYSLGQTKWYILIVGKNKVKFIEKDNVSELNQKIKEFRDFLKPSSNLPNNCAEYEPIASYLYKNLLNDLTIHFKSSKNVIVIPDKLLNLLPFEALTIPNEQGNKVKNFKDLDYFVYHYNVTYSASWKIFENNKDYVFPAKPTLAAFTYAQETNELPNSQEEIMQMKNIFGNRLTSFIGVNCSKKNLNNQFQHVDILHLSLHAASNPTDKFDNKIYFAPKQKDALYGFDIINEKINIPLVVLSACQTAEGKIEAGEGTFSLSRAFQQSGVKNVIASLWKIDNATTAQIMPLFYKNVCQPTKPSLALTQAKRAFLAKKDKILSHPRYWAGLIYIN